MEWFELIKEYEAKHGSFANASYNDDDYILFRFEMIKEEFGVDSIFSRSRPQHSISSVFNARPRQTIS